MTCDHDSMKASLPAFVGATHFVGVQLFIDEVQYMGNCPGCGTTLSVVIDLARGHAVKGEVVVRRVRPDDPPPPFGRVARHLEDLEPTDFNDERIK